MVKAELEKHPEKISSVKIKKVYQTYVVFTLGEIKDLREAAEILQYREEILACEYLQ